MSERTKTRRTETAEVTLLVDGKREAYTASAALVRRIRGLLRKRPIEVEGSVPADVALAGLYAKTGKPATMLRGLRGRDELTQGELAKKLGTNQANVAKMEAGTRPIGKAMAKKLALIFKTDYRVFL